MPRKLLHMVPELHTLLQNAGERPPYILVGHSFGKSIVLMYNKLYPNDVAGAVLAEGGPDRLRLPASIMALSEADLRRRQRRRMFASALYFFGISRFVARKDIEGAGEPTYDQEWSYEAIQPKFVRATTSEVESRLKSSDFSQPEESVVANSP